MSRETFDLRDAAMQAAVAGAPDGPGEETVVVRLARIERAYEELVQRLRRYEEERAQIKNRLERLLIRLGAV